VSTDVRMVASDLDGTLLRSDGTASDRTRAALRAAEDAGLIVAFVTGRPTRWLDEVIETTGHVGVAVGANGAVIYDMETEQLLAAHTLAPDVMLDLATELRRAFPRLFFAVEYGNGFAAEPGYVHDWEINPRVDRRGEVIPPPLVGDLPAILSQPAVKLMAKDRGADVDEMMAGVLDVLGDRAGVTHSSSYGLLEIAAPGVTKATGLAEVARSHGVTADQVAAIGDMPNDVPMLVWAGRSYAVANAHRAAKAVADEVVGSNDEDAVAVLIESILGE
jgi:Cof subfamily protein (haloacid dehalogenase superfamily)